jgi:galactose mutarotase-like enzyme
VEIELWSGVTKAVIDLRGAYITNLSDDLGDILYPKRTFTLADGAKKIRGGCHVCLPNFGPGGESEQLQHGFGRAMDWDVTSQAADSVELTLAHGLSEYSDLASVLTYQLIGQSLTLALEVTNNGATELRVAPGFHPYFSIMHDKETVVLNGEKIFMADFGEAQFTTATAQTLETVQRKFTLESRQLMTWATWTDTLAPYICVEPTLGGFTFLDNTPGDIEILHPGQTRSFAASIAWQYKS